MKVLVTGANGFLGNNIIRELNRRNIPVRALVRNTADISILNDTKAELFYGDMSDKDTAQKATEQCNIVIHAASDTSHSHRDNDDYIRPNLISTINLLDAATTHCVERFIYISTANAFAYGSRSHPGNESQPIKYPFTQSGYAMSKTRAQEKVIEYAKSKKLRTLVVNPTFMLGPYDPKPSSGRIITMMYDRKIIPVPPGGKNFIHVADVASAVCNAIVLGKSGQCYILANENLTYAEFFKKLESVTGRQYHQFKLLPGLMNLIGFAGNLASVAGFNAEISLTNSRMLCAENYYTGEKAVNELGLRQTSIDKAISDALEWFRLKGIVK